MGFAEDLQAGENVQCAVFQLITIEVAEEAIFTGDEGILMCSIKLQ